MSKKSLLIIGIIVGACVLLGVGSMILPFGEKLVDDGSMLGKAEISVTTVPNRGTLTDSRYIDYSSEAFTSAVGKKRVLFFHATWCPTCHTANEAFTTNPNEIPEDVVVLKTDYDFYGDLKKKYGITYQHTFVQVDEQGNEIAKWNGGDLAALRENVR